MKKLSLIAKTKTHLARVSRKQWIIGGSVFSVLLAYSLIFFIPRAVTFSYAETTCVGQLVIAPQLQRGSSNDFTVTYESVWKVGGAHIASMQTCFKPKETLTEGSYTVKSAPLGTVIASKTYTITVPGAPVALVSDIVGKQISTAEPLKVALTSPDVIHHYSISVLGSNLDAMSESKHIDSVDRKAAACTQTDGQLSCDVASLNLHHSASYTLALFQTYKDVDKKLVEGEVTTLRPLLLSSSSITNDQTMYDEPNELKFTFDQSLKKIKVTLKKGETEVKTTQTINETMATLKFEKLERQADYTLTIEEAIAEMGSSLTEPLVFTIHTSGGPKVADVSVGAHSVARNATITVTFDQPIDESIDIAKFAHIEGLSGSVKKRSNTQLTFTIKGGDCSAFKLVIDKGIKSGSNSATTTETWTHAARTICGYSWTIGTSVQGRAITAYSFGSGSKVILFTGGIHGSEPSGYSTMLAWAQYLQAYGDIIHSDKRVVIVPNTNPDGIAANKRYNARNVNVDRNFPTANWSASIETSSGVLPQGGGTAAGSEPEAAALITLTRQLRPRLAVSFHAQGKLVGANKFSDSVAIGNTYAKTVGYKTMFYNAEEVMGYAMTGEYEDWMGEEMGIPAILIELPSASGNYLNSQLSALKKMIAV